MKKIKRIVENNIYMLKFISKFSPSHILTTLILSILQSVMKISSVLFLKFIVDSITFGHDISAVIRMSILIFVINISLSQLNTWINQYNIPKNIQILNREMQLEIFKKSLELDYQCYEDSSFYNDFTVAMQQSDSRALSVLDTFNSFISSLFGITSFGTLITIFEPTLFFIVFVDVLISLVYASISTKIQHSAYHDKLKPSRSSEYAFRVFYQIGFAKELRLFSGLAKIIRRNFTTSTNELIDITKKISIKFIKVSSIQEFLLNLTNLATTIYLTIKVYSSKLRISDFFTLMTSVNQLTSEITTFLQVFPQFYEHSLYIEDFRNFIGYKPSVKDEGKFELCGDSFSIEVKNLSFTYPNTRKRILNDINFSINNGEHVAIVGENGSGKSTLIKILIRLYDPSLGQVYINSKNISDYKIQSLRDNVSVVFQDFSVLSISIGENVLMRPVENENDAKVVEKSLKRVGLLNKVKSTKNGINSIISREYDDEGIILSGGELQRLAVARAYAKECSLLILDEPSSALDSISENDLFDTISKKMRDKTVIFISHKLSNIKNVDKILYIEQGEIIEKGTHSQLMDLNGKYASLYESQASRYNITKIEERN